jgi:hypothetical protein
MSRSPEEQDDERPKDNFSAVEIARANLSYDPPSKDRWRTIAWWSSVLLLVLAIVWLARRLFL